MSHRSFDEEHINLLMNEISTEESITELLIINFLSLGKNVLKNYEKLKILNCPSVHEIFLTLPQASKSLIQNASQILNVKFMVNDEVHELDEVQLLELAITLKETEKSFMISFETSKPKNILIYWRLHEAKNIFSMMIPCDVPDLAHFVESFIYSSLKRNHNAIHSSINTPRGHLRIVVTLNMLADFRGYDLMFLAVEGCKQNLVKHLLNFCDVKYSIKGRYAADLAYEKKYYNILLCLLLGNSRFPNNFQLSIEDNSLPDGLRRFILTSKSMHDAIDSKNISEVLQIVNKHTGLKFIFSIHNVSALSAAMCSDDLAIYKILIEKNLSLGHHEILGDILNTLPFNHRIKLGQINEENFQNITDKHIFILMSSTNVGSDDGERQSRLACVCQAYLKLNTIPRIKLLMEIVAASRNVQITFDFKRDHVQFIDPKSEPYVNGLFYLQGKIYIGALHLLNENKSHEVLGVIAHEFCHFVMFKVFDNLSNPYREDDLVNERIFKRVIERTQALRGIEGNIDAVFECYDEEQQPAELIVRIPHILALYIDQPERAQQLESTFTELSAYYDDDCVPIMEQQLPIIEEESEHLIRRKYSKTNWKLLSFTTVITIVATILLMLGLFPCVLKSCGDDDYAYCIKVGFFKPQCVCIKQHVWFSNICYQCINHKDCSGDRSCITNRCEKNENLFFCNDSKIIYQHQRCDTRYDCEDKSDETYHCVRGFLKKSSFRKLSTYIFHNERSSKKYIDYPDYMLISKLNPDVGIMRTHALDGFIYLPINIYSKFPDLFELHASHCKIFTIYPKNFKNLTNLNSISLEFNEISTIEPNSFDDLHGLQIINMENNKISNFPKDLFIFTTFLRVMRFANNKISFLQENMFVNLKHIEHINFENNEIKSLLCTFIENVSLKNVSFRQNTISEIDETVPYLSYVAENVNFRKNKCVNMCFGKSPLREVCTNNKTEIQFALRKCKIKNIPIKSLK